MKLASVQSLKESIARELQQTRQQTWDLLIGIDPALFYQQAHPEFSPIGWHFGHIAFTEAHWILKHLADQEPGFPEYQLLFAADGLPNTKPNTVKQFLWSGNYISHEIYQSQIQVTHNL